MMEICDGESELLAALTRGELPPGLQQHLASCPVCQEAALTARYLRQLVDSDLASAHVPAPELLWWRAQIIEKRRLGQRSVASISILRDVVILIALFASLAVLITRHPNLQVLIAGILLIGGLLLAVAYEWMDARKILTRRL
jgi:hypothetical protein